ncbi:MAG: lysoplasmalogenase [Acidobacteriota bacterium]
MSAWGVTSALVAGMVVAVVVLLVGERWGRRRLVLAAKPAASAMFLAIGWVLLRPGDPYGAWVLVALVLCLAGDVLLMFPRAFGAGLASFLLGHVAYIVAFHTLRPAASWPIVWSVPIVTASVLATGWLLPHLGRMRGPVVAYVAVITVMVWGALSVGLARPGSTRIVAGAVLFYLSDLSVARDRFVHRGFVNRAWGLPAYYLGQLCLALSVAG